MLDPVKIKARREELNLSLADAALRAGWPRGRRTRWHDIESGRRTSVRLSTLLDMAKALECSVDDILLKTSVKKKS